MPTVSPSRSLALLLVVVSGAAAAQTVRLEPARIDGNPLFTASASMTGAPLEHGLPPGAVMPVRLDSVRHAPIGLEGTSDTLVVTLGTDAEGTWRMFAGLAGAALRPTEDARLGTGTATRTVQAAVLAAADGSTMVFEVQAVAENSFLIYRHLDARIGQADFGGTPRAVALVLAAEAGAYAAGDGLTVYVDADGDGVLDGGMGINGVGATEAHKGSDPFHVGGRAYRLATVAANGSEATFEPVSDDAEALAVGFRMPDLALERLDGTPMRLSDLRGKTVVINWWADFCRPCYLEMPSLTALAAEHADDPTVVFVAIARNTRAELAAALVGRTFGYQQTVAGEDAEALMSDGFPRHIILDADGRVLFDTLGGSEDMGETLGAVLGPILAAQ